MKKFTRKVFAISNLFLLLLIPSAVLAHGEEIVAEDSTIAHQVSDLLPFIYISDGHWVAALLSTILWISLIYSIFILIRKP